MYLSATVHICSSMFICFFIQSSELKTNKFAWSPFLVFEYETIYRLVYVFRRPTHFAWLWNIFLDIPRFFFRTTLLEWIIWQFITKKKRKTNCRNSSGIKIIAVNILRSWLYHILFTSKEIVAWYFQQVFIAYQSCANSKLQNNRYITLFDKTYNFHNNPISNT